MGLRHCWVCVAQACIWPPKLHLIGSMHAVLCQLAVTGTCRAAALSTSTASASLQLWLSQQGFIAAHRTAAVGRCVHNSAATCAAAVHCNSCRRSAACCCLSPPHCCSAPAAGCCTSCERGVTMLSILGSQLAFRYADGYPRPHVLLLLLLLQHRRITVCPCPAPSSRPQNATPAAPACCSAATTLAKKTFEFSITSSLKGNWVGDKQEPAGKFQNTSVCVPSVCRNHAESAHPAAFPTRQASAT